MVMIGGARKKRRRTSGAAAAMTELLLREVDGGKKQPKKVHGRKPRTKKSIKRKIGPPMTGGMQVRMQMQTTTTHPTIGEGKRKKRRISGDQIIKIGAQQIREEEAMIGSRRTLAKTGK